MSTESQQQTPTSPADSLPDDQREQYDQILDELTPYLESETPSPALRKLDRFLDQIPDDEQHALLRSGLWAQRAEFCLDADLDEQAFEDIQRAIDGGWKEADTYSTAGWAAYAMDRPGSARGYFDSALDRDPDHIPALTGRGLALIDIDEHDLAHSDFTHALNLEPKNPELYSLRAEAQIGTRNLEQAERDIRSARDLAPEDTDYALSLTRLKLVQGDVDEARQIVDDAIHEEHPSLESLLLRSHLAMLAGDSSAARRDAIRASNHYPDEAFAFVQLVHVQLAEDNLSLARKAADRAVKLDPSLPDAYMVRGAALQMQGKQEEAQEDIDRANQAPAELPMFLLGSFYEILEESGFNHSMMDLLDQYTSIHQNADQGEPGAQTGPGGLGGFDPEDVMDQVFDESGNIDDEVKPFLEMALENAPSILKNLPPGIVQGLGGIDPSDLDDLSSDEIERQMKDLYKMMQSGQNPFDMFDGEGDGPMNDSDDDRD